MGLGVPLSVWGSCCRGPGAAAWNTPAGCYPGVRQLSGPLGPSSGSVGGSVCGSRGAMASAGRDSGSSCRWNRHGSVYIRAMRAISIRCYCAASGCLGSAARGASATIRSPSLDERCGNTWVGAGVAVPRSGKILGVPHPFGLGVGVLRPSTTPSWLMMVNVPTRLGGIEAAGFPPWAPPRKGIRA